METIITPTGSLEESINFYRKIGFEQISESPALFCDGSLVVEIAIDRYARKGIKFYGDDWTEILSRLRNLTYVQEYEHGHIASDPNGIKTYFVKEEFSHNVPDEKTSIIGNFAGISIEAVDFKKTADFWGSIGYKLKDGSEGAGWATYSSGSNIDVSIMGINTCPHLFFNPGLTYFNGAENVNIIKKVRANGVAITEEITHFNKEGIVDNIVIRDPGGLGFFLFSD